VWVGAGAQRGENALRRALDEEAIADVIFVRYESSQTWVASVLVQSGRVLVPAGNIVYWQDRGSRLVPSAANPDAAFRASGLRILGPGDSSVCVEAMQATFVGYLNHYASNPWLRPIDAGAAYADWALRSLGGRDYAVVGDMGPSGDVRAIALVHISEQTAEVLLAGVVPGARGRGAYSTFIVAIAEACARLGLSRVVISTQDHNVAVQRLWCRAGFEPVVGVTIVHSMTPDFVDTAVADSGT
jgi:GNAT superfamily N-acetyltransferase